VKRGYGEALYKGSPVEREKTGSRNYLDTTRYLRGKGREEKNLQLRRPKVEPAGRLISKREA